jgi:hypothetical protein
MDDRAERAGDEAPRTSTRGCWSLPGDVFVVCVSGTGAERCRPGERHALSASRSRVRSVRRGPGDVVMYMHQRRALCASHASLARQRRSCGRRRRPHSDTATQRHCTSCGAGVERMKVMPACALVADVAVARSSKSTPHHRPPLHRRRHHRRRRHRRRARWPCHALQRRRGGHRPQRVRGRVAGRRGDAAMGCVDGRGVRGRR